jgi:exodeoxyribonuclease VII large subunit
MLGVLLVMSTINVFRDARRVAAVSLETSPEKPASLHSINSKIAEWIKRLGEVWVEGQITQINARTGAGQAYLGLRDLEKNASAQVVTASATIAGLNPSLSEGDRVVVLIKPEYWINSGRLQLRAREIRAVGLGDLLARVERLKQELSNEGLFARERKKPLPFLPQRIGLICGRDSAAERDVIENAVRRWPGIKFELRQVAVQGLTAATAVTEALLELDARSDVDVIVITRGGGSVEDLLPFSDEQLVRAVAAAKTPIVSAIGHEQDTPLLDYVADVRASTPTDAAMRIVPDLEEQFELVHGLRDRSLRAVSGRLDREQNQIQRWAAHPGLADPSALIATEMQQVKDSRTRFAKSLAHHLQLASEKVVSLKAQLRTVSPAATLDRGYAIVLNQTHHVIRASTEVGEGELLTLRLADGQVPVTVNEGTQ